MAIANMTFQKLAIDTVASWISTNCTNISNYAGIPAAFKSGYSDVVTYAGTGTAAVSKHTATIAANAVPQVTSATVTSEMTSFLSARGITDLTKNIPQSEFLDFVKDMISFACTKCTWTTSQFNTNKYLIYWSGNTTFYNYYALTDTATTKVSAANDVVELSKSVIDIVRQNIRNKAVKYSITLSA